MAICPYCQTHDKNFFAGKCHACNTPVGFFEQVFTSLVWTATYVGGTIFFIWLAFEVLFG